MLTLVGGCKTNCPQDHAGHDTANTCDYLLTLESSFIKPNWHGGSRLVCVSHCSKHCLNKSTKDRLIAHDSVFTIAVACISSGSIAHSS
jgi:hypothetical protein